MNTSLNSTASPKKTTRSSSPPTYKHVTPIKSSNIVVSESQYRNIGQMSNQLAQSRAKGRRNTSPSKGNQANATSPSKKRVTFGYPKFSRAEYQQQYMKENVNEEEEQNRTINSNGVLIDRKDIEQAFRFFDVHKRNRITAKDLKQRLKVFYPNMSNNEYKFLISDNNFTVDKLVEILQSNVLTNYDPYKEAFKVFDPADTGYVDTEVLSSIMTQLGYGAISSDDLSVLIETADVDRDGRISLEDFRNMLDPEGAKEKKAKQQAELSNNNQE